MDTNRNGVIDLDEFLTIMAGSAAGKIVDSRLQKLVELQLEQQRVTTVRSNGGL